MKKPKASNGRELQALHLKYRPKTLDDVVGQPQAVKMLKGYLKAGNLPHVLLFLGPGGTGKSSLAHILGRHLGCKDRANFLVYNCAKDGGMDMVKSIANEANRYAQGGIKAVKALLLEEMQSLSRAGFSQQALLDLLEHTPPHVYFFLTATDGSKINKPLKTRCAVIPLKPVGRRDLTALLEFVLAAEGRDDVGSEVLERIVERADGSPRQAQVDLGRVLAMENDEDRLALLGVRDAGDGDETHPAIRLCRVLVNPRASWTDAAQILREMEDELNADADGPRWQVLGYASKVLMGGKSDARADAMLIAFEGSMKESGRGGFVRACREVMGKR